ncbi:pentatricopeptide repeat-containing-like protein [Cinnamomum micranthum f. kanehirae]|uniref:Pentatricopeptide repeat-containing-like protein n=1 Tax=Cinnamomum micranthum f. kanehirae TaxID=337451 RepID=A0A443NWU7_9MAGN|nr:pentatricopeptide repeat-containing-like protein [Cinnamomum micranthum f. kanehirae]
MAAGRHGVTANMNQGSGSSILRCRGGGICIALHRKIDGGHDGKRVRSSREIERAKEREYKDRVRVRQKDIKERKAVNGGYWSSSSMSGACADVDAMSVGQRVHQIINQCELDSKPNVITALIDMYSKCGCIDTARRLFDELVEKDVFAWTAIVSGLASHGQSTDAIELFHRMQELIIRMDDRTITAVLSASRC